MNGDVRDNVVAGVLEPTMSKVRSLKSAYEAAISLLRIDDAIQCVPGKELYHSTKKSVADRNRAQARCRCTWSLKKDDGSTCNPYAYNVYICTCRLENQIGEGFEVHINANPMIT